MSTLLLDDTALGWAAAAAEPKKELDPSPVERLHADLCAYQAIQDEALARLREVSRRVRSPRAKFALETIIAGKAARQHLTASLVVALADALNWTSSKDNPLRGCDEGQPEDPEALSVLTELADVEIKGAKAARRLAKAASGIDSGLDQLLLESVAVESKAGSRILKGVVAGLAAAHRDERRGGGRRVRPTSQVGPFRRQVPVPVPVSSRDSLAA